MWGARALPAFMVSRYTCLLYTSEMTFNSFVSQQEEINGSVETQFSDIQKYIRYVAVSYTHLDVYKRQALECVVLPEEDEKRVDSN